MADDGVIAAYIRELRFSVAALPDADDIAAEAEDHLLEAVERLEGSGRTRAESEVEALARFGSAALVSRVCIAEARRGAAVPTTRTRFAGMALLAAPALVAFGQLGNVTIERGAGHGFAVFLLVLAFPALMFGLWGLRVRHGGLGRLGPAALAVALVSPILALAASWAAIFALALLLSLAVVVFAIEMLRASVLPILSLVIFGAGPFGVLGVGALATVITVAGGDAGDLPGVVLVAPVAVTGIGLGALGWHLVQERAVDRDTNRRRSFASS